LCVWATNLGYTNALQLLKKTINEEENADKKLSQLAVSINFEAVTAG
jgi:ferritin-like metal-binding protein YciE